MYGRYERHWRIGSGHDYDAGVNDDDASLAMTSSRHPSTNHASTVDVSWLSTFLQQQPSHMYVLLGEASDELYGARETRALVSVCGRRSTDRQISTTHACGACVCVCVCVGSVRSKHAVLCKWDVDCWPHVNDTHAIDTPPLNVNAPNLGTQTTDSVDKIAFMISALSALWKVTAFSCSSPMNDLWHKERELSL